MSDPTQEIPTVYISFVYGAFTLFGRLFHGRSTRNAYRIVGSYNPPHVKRGVWPIPFSLATTQGISIDFFSSAT